MIIMENEWKNPNQAEQYKLVIEEEYEEEGCDNRYAIDIVHLCPISMLEEKESQYSLPGIDILDVGEGWVQIRMHGTATLHVGESHSTGWYNIKPYWQACKTVTLKRFNE